VSASFSAGDLAIFSYLNSAVVIGLFSLVVSEQFCVFVGVLTLGRVCDCVFVYVCLSGWVCIWVRQTLCSVKCGCNDLCVCRSRSLPYF
jgi:hypothetical protein